MDQTHKSVKTHGSFLGVAQKLGICLPQIYLEAFNKYNQLLIP